MKDALRDQRGAIMVMGLFMAIFATGCLFYLVGLGEAIAQRERMQDAADAAAFSSAVLHARGMNVIALVNMTMAALLAALIVLKLVELAGYIGVAVATGLAFFTSGLSLSAVPLFAELSFNAREAHDAAQPTVHTSLRVLRIASRGVRVVMPWVAQAASMKTIVAHYAPPAVQGFSVPGRITLPTRDGSYEGLCRKAGEYVGDLVSVPFAGIATPGFSLGEITGGLIGAGSAWFCETEGGARPGTWVTREIWHPVLPKALECGSGGRGVDGEPGLAQAQHEQLCAEAQRQTVEADAAIDPITGACVERPGSSCGLDGLYELRATLAQSDCAPRAVGDDSLSQFKWQARTFARRYTWDDGEWKVSEELLPDTERHRLYTTPARPCGSPSSFSPEWSSVRRDDGGELVPICDNIAPPSTLPIDNEYTVDILHTEVLQMFQCFEQRSEHREIEGEGGGLAASQAEGEEMAPQLIAEGAQLGEEDFQIRALVIGDGVGASPIALLGGLNSPEEEANAAEIAAWSAARTLGSIAVAQAEFYFDDAAARSEDLLWSMRWTARLRRFHASDREPEPATPDDIADAALHATGAVHTTLESACALLGPKGFPCGAIDLSLLSNLAAH
jgi:hypothetical protein